MYPAMDTSIQLASYVLQVIEVGEIDPLLFGDEITPTGMALLRIASMSQSVFTELDDR